MESLSPYRCQLQRIFIYYASFGDKENTTLLKIQNHHRLLADLQLLSSHQYQTNDSASLAQQCDVLFYSKASPAGLTLHKFQLLLQAISKVFFSEEGELSFSKLFRCHLQPLHDHIMAQTEFGKKLSILQPHLFRESAYELLVKFQNSLTIIYNFYFQKGAKQGADQQHRIFMKMSRELGFLPKIISKPIAQIIYGFLTERNSTVAFRSASSRRSRNRGGQNIFSFDLGCFMDYLIVLSHIARSQEQEGDHIKLYRLLQRLQVSKGYQSIAKNIKIDHFFINQNEVMSPVKSTKKTNGEYLIIDSNKKVQMQLVQTPLKKKLGEYFSPLKSKFIELCTKKRVQSNFYLPQETTLTMLSKICPKLSSTICLSLLSSFKSTNMSFQKFINLLDLTAERVKIERERLYDQVVVYSENGIGLGMVLDNMKLDQKQMEECRQILYLCRNYLRNIFEFYQYSGVLSLTNFLRMLEETKLIPIILDKMQASDLYTICCKESGMKFQDFQLSLLRMTVSLNFQADLQGVQRLLYLLQIICSSQRGESLMKRNNLMIKQHPLYKIHLLFDESYSKMREKCKIK